MPPWPVASRRDRARVRQRPARLQTHDRPKPHRIFRHSWPQAGSSQKRMAAHRDPFATTYGTNICYGTPTVRRIPRSPAGTGVQLRGGFGGNDRAWADSVHAQGTGVWTFSVQKSWGNRQSIGAAQPREAAGLPVICSGIDQQGERRTAWQSLPQGTGCHRQHGTRLNQQPDGHHAVTDGFPHHGCLCPAGWSSRYPPASVSAPVPPKYSRSLAS